MKKTSLALLWHLHQPLYRLRGEKTCFLPWVRLHAIRSYYDMIRVLEEFPEMRVTFNLVPVLVEQIRAYESGAGDLFLETGAVPAEDLDERRRAFLLEHFFSAHEREMIGAFPRFAELKTRRDRALRFRGPAEAWKEFSTDDLRDLQALFDLSWLGFKAREDFPEIEALARQGGKFAQHDIRRIHEVEREILKSVLPLYREAAGRGQIEISASPYAHPILPLLLDTDSAKEAMPQGSLPPRFRRPEDARAQVENALDRMERELGMRPRGVWPSEGSLSQETAEILASCGVRWAGSDEEVLARSDRREPADISMPWRSGAGREKISLVFRDHDLSDRIGFVYSGMEAGRAVEDFLGGAEQRMAGREGNLLFVALDGENPWESFRGSGADFLRRLYASILASPRFAGSTVSEAVEASAQTGEIRRLHAGSWIRADFGTWIGGPEKNEAWTILGGARSDLSAALDDPRIDAERRGEAWGSLRAAEGSDWFWWLDGQFSTDHRLQFDELFRGHLRQAYESLGRDAPASLSLPIPRPAPAGAEGSIVEPPAWLAPKLDGYEGDFFEWEGAATLRWPRLSPSSTLERSKALFEAIRLGFSRTGDFFLRIDPPAAANSGYFGNLWLTLELKGSGAMKAVALDLDEAGNLRQALREDLPREVGVAAAGSGRPSGATAMARKIFEMAVPGGETGLKPGEEAEIRIALGLGGEPITLREIRIRVPAFSSGSGPWNAL
ncbi:MAG TPA: glycoside hydrolase family 57 protein [Candidatus Polarisedimenticolia bacterium]|jgi:alpha-amylase/alpha-mannosidase (GH57 family)|nr:glycoside hydrolase family 57 protein [Candidatus Polarisedimenticolia bacterium]